MAKLTDGLEGAWLAEVLKDALERELQEREILTLQILESEFEFTKEQLNRYAELKMQKMKEARTKVK